MRWRRLPAGVAGVAWDGEKGKVRGLISGGVARMLCSLARKDGMDCAPGSAGCGSARSRTNREGGPGMAEDVVKKAEEFKDQLEDAWRRIPKPFRNERTIRGSLRCRLFGILENGGLRPVADYMPPRIADRPVDVIALKDDLEVVYAVCIDTVVTLAAVKSLNSFEAARKIIFTTGMLEKKVQESRFFLSGDIEHVHLRP